MSVSRCRSLSRAWLLIALFIPTLGFAAKPAKWIAVQSPLFTILTPAPEATARRWAVELEQFRRAMQSVVSVPEASLQPVLVLLLPTDRELRPLKPLENGKPQALGGFFVDVGGVHALALALDANEETTRRVVFHEAVHWYSASSEQTLPAWLEEGVAEVYSTFRVEGDTCSFGLPMQDHVQLLVGGKIDVERLVLTPREGLKFNEGNRATLFYARSWLMTHYLLYGQGSPGRAGIARYAERITREPDLGKAFRDAFGCDYATFSERLRDYLKNGRYVRQQFRVPATDIAAKLTVRAATAAEVERTKGALVLGGRRGDTTAALPFLLRAAELAPNDPLVWQLLGAARLMEKDEDAAAVCFGRAVDAGSTSYYAHYGFAAAKLQDQDRVTDSFSPALAAQAAVAFRRAIELNPRYLPAYEGLAGVVSALEVYDPADRARLEQGARLDPDSVGIDVGLATADMREGNVKRGRQRLQLALDDPRASADVKTFARKLLHAQDWQVLEGEVMALFSKSEYQKVVAVIDDARPRFKEPQLRQLLDLNRRTALAADRLTRAIEHANAGRTTQAQQLLSEVVASDAEARDKNEAKRLLGLLAK